MKDGVTLSRKESERLRLLTAVKSGELSRLSAAERLGVCVRQLKRLLRRLRDEGPEGLVSRRRGRASNRRLRDETRAQVIELAGTRYRGFGPTLLHEKLVSEHGLTLSVESVRQVLVSAGQWKARRRRREVHPSRERRPRFGELIQIDGSPHDWFEGRAERCTLLAFIDDATGRITAARFMPTETTAGYFLLLGEHLRRYGRPHSLYSDRHSIFVLNEREGSTPEGRTQFGRALEQLEIEGICAYSPQAKGRVERLFRTCQDRLVKEMRLLEISSMEAANDFLPQFVAWFNTRFAVVPSSAGDAHRAVVESPRALQLILCERETRKLSKDLGCQHRGQHLLVQADHRRRRLAGQRITVCNLPDGEIVLLSGELEELPWRPGPRKSSPVKVEDDKTLNAQVDAVVARRPVTTPADTHPWKRAFKATRASAGPRAVTAT